VISPYKQKAPKGAFCLLRTMVETHSRFGPFWSFLLDVYRPS
jgi:hypothetical protein